MQVRREAESIIFRHEGVLYDTTTLLRIDTNSSTEPAIFLTQDKTKAFLMSVNQPSSLQIAALSPYQLRAWLLKLRYYV
jgi:hypothetical protein